MIRISDLHFRYREGDFGLRVPELAVKPGEQIAVIGASGSGKTTLLHLMAGIVTPMAGVVATGGRDLTALDDAQRRAFRIRKIGLVFQEFELLEYLTVIDNILLPYRIHRALALDAAVRSRAAALAERLGVAHALGRFIGHLSHGERQRVAVCRALVAAPELILADEPTGNLDPANKLLVLDILIERARERGATLVVVTHDHDLLDRFSRVIDVKTFGDAGPAA